MRLHQLVQENVIKYTQWQNEFDSQYTAGNASMEFWKDEVHNSLIAERKQLLRDLLAFSEQQSEEKRSPQAYQDLSPEDRVELKEMLMEQLKSTLPELLASIAITLGADSSNGIGKNC